MSGGCIGTGLLTNNGNKISGYEMNKILDLSIIDLIIHIIPLSTSSIARSIRAIGTGISSVFIHPALTPTLSHIAIQLNMINGSIVVLEYGQYFTKDSIIENTGIFTSCDSKESSKKPRKNKNENIYYYINRDGARLTLINKKYYKTREDDFYVYYTQDGRIISLIIAAQHYGLEIEEFIENCSKKSYQDQNGIGSGFEFKCIECNIKNRMSLRELCNHFIGKKWEAKNYNVVTHNCQTFAAEVIKVLKAIRKYEYDKIRTHEKKFLPNCIISALWDNEDLSAVNTIGRIPIIGFFYDLIHSDPNY